MTITQNIFEDYLFLFILKEIVLKKILLYVKVLIDWLALSS